MKPLLRVLYLPPWPPSIRYRAWASEGEEFSLLRWFVERLVERYGAGSLLIACQDPSDRPLAEQVLGELRVFVTLCGGETLLEALGELSRAFPESHIAYFHLEMMFAPSDLLDRVCAHHVEHGNDFTYVSGLPPLLTPEVAWAPLISSIAAAGAPSLREAALKLADIRKEPFPAACFYESPNLNAVSQLCTREDADRARQVLSGLPALYEFEAVQRWPDTVFDPLRKGLAIETRRREGPEVLYLSPTCVYSGAEECLRGLVEGLGKLGVGQTAVVGFEGLLAERLRSEGCQVLAANWDFRASVRFAREVLETVRPDCIHCNSNPGPAFLDEAQRRGVPIITHARIAAVDGFDALHSASERIIAVSEFTKSRLIQAGRPAEKIAVIPEGIDPQRFMPGVFDRREMRRQFGIPQDAFMILMIARLVVDKRHDLMLTAFASLRQRRPEVRLVFVVDRGNLPLLRQLQGQADTLGVTDYVTWLPFQDDIRKIECAADVVALPSDNEAFGICILEGMSLGIPVIVSDAGGAVELVEDRVSGLVMRGGDAGSLANGLTILADDSTLRDKIGQAGRVRVERLFTLRQHAQRVAAVMSLQTLKWNMPT